MDSLIESELLDRVARLEHRVSQLELALDNDTLHQLDTELAVQGFR
jgi:hypothetical protein